MKKFTLLLLGILVCSLTGIAQLSIQNASTNTSTLEECGTDAIHQQLMATDPIYKQKMDAFNNLLKNSAVNNKMGTLYRVPVVVHVMHKGEAIGTGSNISDASIRQGIRQLNERYRKVAGSLGDGNGVDVEIEFALAVRDESNNCTDGIVRYSMTSHSNYMNFGLNRNNSNGMDESVLKGLSRWDPNEYYNIYLVYEIDDNECGFGIQGFAYLAGAHGNAVDGMVQLACKFAESGNTTLTHEIGHAFNLYHTFQGDNGGSQCPTGSGDFCNDTPEHIRSSSDCVVATNSCTGGSSNEHIHNYMDYSSDACQNEFTSDQRIRARTALTGTRASFLTSNGNLSLTPPAAPTANFSASTTATCLGNSISFYDESTCIPNTFQNSSWPNISFLWTFDNGVNPAVNSTLQNPIMTFANAGTYSVTLQVTNASGTNSTTKVGYISISSGSPSAACTPSSTNPPANYGYAMSNVTFETINNTTSSGSNQEYVDYSCDIATTVEVNSTYNLSVTLNNSSSFSEDVEVYIDYNDDGTFQAGELIMSKSLAAGAGSGTFTEPITIPGTATTGKILRMRAHADANGVGSLCSNTFVGDVEDYGVFITSACSQPDVPTISGTTTICNGSSTNLSIVTGNLNDATDWQWYTSSCGGTSVGNGTSINVSPTVTTTYFVRGEGGCVSGGPCAQFTVTVNDVPGNAGSIVGSASVCDNATGIGYSISAVAGATSYTWIVPTGATVVSGQGSTSISVNFGTTSGNVEVTPSNTCGSGGAATLAVSVGPCGSAPVADFNGSPTTICEGNTISFSDLSTNTPTSWSWSFPGGTPSTSTAQSPTITYSSAGTYQVQLTATNAFGSDIETKVGYITVNACGTTKLRTQDCGITLPDYLTYITCDWVPGATAYEYEFVNTGLGYNQTYIRYSNKYRFVYLNNVPGIQNGTTYDVRVRAYVGGIWGNYGVVCQVTTPGSSVTTQLRSQDCGLAITSYANYITCEYVFGATEYEYEFVNTGLGYNQTYLRTNPSYRHVYMHNVPGILDNTTYNVRVRAKIGGVFTSFGATCQITTPNSLTTNLISSDCGIVMTSFSNYINCNYVAGATEYEYEFVNTGLGYNQTYVKGNPNYRFLYVDSMPGILLNTTYDVRVRAKVDGNYTNYGSICQITTPPTLRVINTEGTPKEEEALVTQSPELKIYPNPNQGEFMYVELKGYQPNSSLVVMDVSGKILDQRLIGSDTQNYSGTFRFNEKLKPGFYFITLQSGNSKITKKLIVR